MKEVFLDVGELGWSLYLSAHIRWLKRQGRTMLTVMVLPERECLYEGLADTIFNPPEEFYRDFDLAQQSCFHFYNMRGSGLRKYFNTRLPSGHRISETQSLDDKIKQRGYRGKMLFEPYPYKTMLEGKKEILVFPRLRRGGHFKLRNLPKVFYMDLINRLCGEFKDCIIRALGIVDGAYSAIEIPKNNYVNFVGRTPSLQMVIDRCQIAIGAVGSQSAPLKLTLLQKVPTFMIGHDQKRHVEEENWSGTRVGFHRIDKRGYNEFKSEKCITDIVSFFKEQK